jgi:hypothetical protein
MSARRVTLPSLAEATTSWPKSSGVLRGLSTVSESCWSGAVLPGPTGGPPTWPALTRWFCLLMTATTCDGFRRRWRSCAGSSHTRML